MVRLSYIVAIFVVVLTSIYAEDVYNDRYDDINIDSILQNNKLRDQYYNCFMERAPCLTADAQFFQAIFKEAFQTQCKKCTEKQKALLDKIVDWYTKNKPDQWQTFVTKSIEDLRKKNA